MEHGDNVKAEFVLPLKELPEARSMFGRALFVGRFQPFHYGHLHGVRTILGEAEELVIVVGSAQMSHEPDNPFTAGERIEMIQCALDEGGVDRGRYLLIPIPDAPAHRIWVSQVESQTPKFEIVYTNQPLTRRLLIEAGYEVRDIEMYKREEYSATEIRRRILLGLDWRPLVPKGVYGYMQEIRGEERIRDLARTDAVNVIREY